MYRCLKLGSPYLEHDFQVTTGHGFRPESLSVHLCFISMNDRVQMSSHHTIRVLLNIFRNLLSHDLSQLHPRQNLVRDNFRDRLNLNKFSQRFPNHQTNQTTLPKSIVSACRLLATNNGSSSAARSTTGGLPALELDQRRKRKRHVAMT